MGLGGRKEKQRIPHDPRNLSWADDANKFGAAYLQKLGWSAGTGLGTTGEGRTSHIKVHQKLDMLGIGAAHQKDPNGLAWKQNKDFENLLRRLNAANGEGEVEEVSTKIDGFEKAQKLATAEVEVEASKKRKRDPEDKIEEVKETKEERKKRKKEEKEMGKREKKEKKGESVDEDDKAVESTPPVPAPSVPSRPVIGRPVRAHRARFMASKNIASKSSAAIDEILGISRSGTSTPYPTTSITDTPLDPSSSSSPSEEDGLKLQELTTSSKSVMDYFKEKLLAKSNSASYTSSFAATTSTSTPRNGVEEFDDYDDRPRGGLGVGSSKMGLGASKLRSEVTFEQGVEETTRTGLGVFSRMSAMFSAAKVSDIASETVMESVEVTNVEETAAIEASSAGKGERKKKQGKGKKREEAGVSANDAEGGDETEVKKEKRKRDRKQKRAEEIAERATEEEVSKPMKKRKHREDESGGSTELKPAKKKSKKVKEKKVDAEDNASKDESAQKKRKSRKIKSSEFVDSDS